MILSAIGDKYLPDITNEYEAGERTFVSSLIHYNKK